MLVISNEDQLLDDHREAVQHREVVANLDLTGFVEYHRLWGNKSCEGWQFGVREHAQCAQNDTGTEEKPFNCHDIVDEVIGTDEEVCDNLPIQMLVPTETINKQ